MFKKISSLALVISLAGIITTNSFGELSEDTKNYGSKFWDGLKQDLKNTAKDAGNSIKNGVSTAADWTKEKATAAGNAVKTTAQNVGTATKTAYNNTVDWTKEKATAAGTAIKTTAQNVGTATKTAYNNTVDWTKEKATAAGTAIKTTAQNVGTATKTAYNNTVDWTKTTAHNAGVAISGAAHTVAEGTVNAYNSTVSGVQAGAEWTKEKAVAAGSAIKTTAQNTGKAIVTTAQKVDDWVDEKEYQLARTVLSEETIDNYQKFKSGVKKDLAATGKETVENIKTGTVNAYNATVSGVQAGAEWTKEKALAAGHAVSDAAHTLAEGTVNAYNTTVSGVQAGAEWTKEKALAAGHKMQEVAGKLGSIGGLCKSVPGESVTVTCAGVSFHPKAIRESINKLARFVNAKLKNNMNTPEASIVTTAFAKLNMCLFDGGATSKLQDVTIGKFADCCGSSMAELKDYEGYSCEEILRDTVRANNNFLEEEIVNEQEKLG